MIEDLLPGGVSILEWIGIFCDVSVILLLQQLRHLAQERRGIKVSATIVLAWWTQDTIIV